MIDEVGKILNPQNNSQYNTIHGLYSPDEVPKYPFVRYDADGEDTLMNQASPVFHNGFQNTPAIKPSIFSPS